MRAFPKNNPFEGLRDSINAKKEEDRSNLNKRFENILQGHFDRIPRGLRYESRLPSIESVAVLDYPGNKGAYLVVYYNGKRLGDGKDVIKHITLTLTNDSRLIGELPQDLRNLSKDDILSELLDTTASLHIGSWGSLQGSFLPPGKWDQKREPGKDGSDRGPYISQEDIDRIQHIQSMHGYIYSFYPEQESRGGGFQEYQIHLFPHVAIFESPATGNNTYFIKFDGKEVPGKIADKIRNGEMNNNEILTVLGELGISDDIRTSVNKTKQQVKERGGRYDHPHPPINSSPEFKENYYQHLEETVLATG